MGKVDININGNIGIIQIGDIVVLYGCVHEGINSGPVYVYVVRCYSR
jgi:hypothetical protein